MPPYNSISTLTNVTTSTMSLTATSAPSSQRTRDMVCNSHFTTIAFPTLSPPASSSATVLTTTTVIKPNTATSTPPSPPPLPILPAEIWWSIFHNLSPLLTYTVLARTSTSLRKTVQGRPIAVCVILMRDCSVKWGTPMQQLDLQGDPSHFSHMGNKRFKWRNEWSRGVGDVFGGEVVAAVCYSDPRFWKSKSDPHLPPQTPEEWSHALTHAVAKHIPTSWPTRPFVKLVNEVKSGLSSLTHSYASSLPLTVRAAKFYADHDWPTALPLFASPTLLNFNLSFISQQWEGPPPTAELRLDTLFPHLRSISIDCTNPDTLSKWLETLPASIRHITIGDDFVDSDMELLDTHIPVLSTIPSLLPSLSSHSIQVLALNACIAPDFLHALDPLRQHTTQDFGLIEFTSWDSLGQFDVACYRRRVSERDIRKIKIFVGASVVEGAGDSEWPDEMFWEGVGLAIGRHVRGLRCVEVLSAGSVKEESWRGFVEGVGRGCKGVRLLRPWASTE